MEPNQALDNPPSRRAGGSVSTEPGLAAAPVAFDLDVGAPCRPS